MLVSLTVSQVVSHHTGAWDVKHFHHLDIFPLSNNHLSEVIREINDKKINFVFNHTEMKDTRNIM